MRSHDVTLLHQQLHIAQTDPVPELGREAEAQVQKAAQKVLVVHVSVGVPNLALVVHLLTLTLNHGMGSSIWFHITLDEIIL